ncbi:ArnT family glycosyltransferase [Amycolatopsis suaedae]|uniref:Glycosyl transferase n=1 Tax=Amycolatopsis suaedae TaxID=2510978 RepID=A0A4Q7J0C6_9PSEU|nr:glycosyl transferase [Amycolatopsis suaedae]
MTVSPVTGVKPALATRPVLLLAAAVGGLLLAVSGRYGYFGDELYFVAAGRHLDWGYADQPPLLPLLALLMDTLWPGSVVALRLPATILTAVGVVVAAQLARELGGRRRAQLLTAGAYALWAPLYGHLLATSTVDPFLWMLILWLVVRWQRTRADRLLLLAGVVTAVALQAKHLVIALLAALVISAFLAGRRDLLTRPALWAGAGIAAVTSVPNLLWQIDNDWPLLQMSATVSTEMEITGGRLTFLPLALTGLGGLAGLALALYGLWNLLRAKELRPYRYLGWAFLIVVTVFLVSNGRPYYIAGFAPVLWAFGAVRMQDGEPSRWWRWIPTWPVYAVTSLTLVVGLPILPMSVHAGLPRQVIAFQRDEIGWPQLADDVAAVYHALPPETREHTALMSQGYWAASALDFYGPERGLPRAYSPHRGYWYFGRPGDGVDSVVYVGEDVERLREHFTSVRRVGTVDNGLNINNALQGKPILFAEGLREPWSQTWPELRRMAN